MPAMRCSICARYFDVSVTTCPECGAQTWRAESSEPDVATGNAEEWYELRAPAEERVYDAHHDAKLIDWRMLCFLRAGLEHLHASALAIRRDVDREEVERLLNGGATPAQVLEIVT